MPRPTDVPGWVSLTKADHVALGLNPSRRLFLDDTGQVRSRRAYEDARSRLAGWTDYAEVQRFRKQHKDVIMTFVVSGGVEGRRRWKEKPLEVLYYFKSAMEENFARTTRGGLHDYLSKGLGIRDVDATYPPGETPKRGKR